MKKQAFINLLFQRKSQKIKKKRLKPLKWHYPLNIEKQYDRILKSLVNDLKYYIKEIIIPQIPSLIKEVNQNTPNDRQDSFIDRLNQLIIYVGNAIQGKIRGTIVESDLVAVEINRFNKNQAQRMNQNLFGIDIFADEPWLKDQLSLFAAQNAQLITSIPEQELSKVQEIIERGLQQGLRFTELTDEIQKSFGVTKRRANLIARDQTQKLNASLTRLRQQDVGIEKYEWMTSMDERVRPTHRENQGKVFEWARPPAKTGHPGHDVNCRCWASPIFEEE